MKRALVFGCTGQDGSYLCELLLSKGYTVFGVMRRSSSFNTHRVDHLYRDPHENGSRFRLIFGDLSDAPTLNRILRDVRPHEIYNLGAQSHVRVSFDLPEYTANVNALGCLRILEAMRETALDAKLYQASSSEMFGDVLAPQSETTVFDPASPYAAAKCFAYHTVRNYRRAYSIFAANGILFNHESPRRGETFVTRKIAKAVARISAGLQDRIYLGNLEAKRDWGWAPDYVEAMWMMLQQNSPDDYCIATGESHTVKEFVEEAFRLVNLAIHWDKTPGFELGLDQNNVVRVDFDSRYLRPTEVHHLEGDATKAKDKLGWAPTFRFKEIVQAMVLAEVKAVNGQG